MFPNVVIVIILSLPSVIAFHVLEDSDGSNGSYRLCLNTIVDDFFENGQFIYVIADDFDDDALLKISQPKIILNANSIEKYSSKPSVIGYNYIIRVKKERSLRGQLRYLFDNGILRRKLAPKCKFLVITSEVDIKPMFQTMWNYNAFDVVVLVSRMFGKDKQLKWYHSDPFTVENGCGKTPNVTREQKCTDRVKVTVKRSFRGNKYCPVDYLNSHSTNMKDEAAQFVFTVLGVLKEQYHFNIKIDKNSPANFSTRLLLQKNHREYLDGVSQEFFIQKWVWFLPVPEKLSPLEIYFVIFQKEVWVMFFVGFALALVFYVVISALHGLPVNMSSIIFINLEILSLTLWGSHSISPKIRAIRLFLLCYAFYAIVLQTAYTSNLIRVLTIPQHEKGIETLEELADSAFHIHAHKLIGKLLNKTDTNYHEFFKKFKQKLIIFPDYHSPYNALEQLIKYNNCSVMTFESRAAIMLKKLSNNNITLINNKIIFDTSLFGYYANLFSYDPIPDYHVLHHLDIIITALKENGIYTRLAEKRSSLSKEFVRATGHSTDPQVLSIEHLYGIFVIYGIGMFMACIVFIIEIIMGKWSRRKIYSPVIILHAPEIQSCSNNDNN